MAETIALVVGGFVAPYITGWLKALTGWKKKAIFLASMIVAVVIAFLSIWVASWFDSSVSITAILTGTGSGAVWILSQSVYKLFNK